MGDNQMASLIAPEQSFLTKKYSTTKYRIHRPTQNKSVTKALLFIP